MRCKELNPKCAQSTSACSSTGSTISAREANVSPENSFALPRIIGLDRPGAVQFSRQGANTFHEGWLVPVSAAKIAHRLSQSRAGGNGWITENER